MPFHDTGDARLYYEVTGDGPWLVLAHGGEGTRIHWWAQVAALQDRFRCVTFDARHHGQSSGTATSGDAHHRDDLRSLMDGLGIDRAHLVGHSMGGLAVSGVALAHPERVERLVMSGTPFGFATEALSTWAAAMAEKVAAGFDVLAHLHAPDFPRRDPERFHLLQALGRLNHPRDLTDPAVRARQVRVYEVWRDQPVQDHRAFDVPTLFIVGAEDQLTPPWLIRATAEAVGGATFQEILGAGHSTYVERSTAFNDLVARFLAAPQPPRASGGHPVAQR